VSWQHPPYNQRGPQAQQILSTRPSIAAPAGRSIPVAADDAAVRFHLDFEDRGLVGAGELDERLLATGARFVGVGPVADFLDGGPVMVVAAGRTGFAGLLTARFSGRRRGRGRGIGVGRGGVGLGVSDLGGSAEEVLLEESDFGVEESDAVLVRLLALEGAAVQGVVVGGLAPGAELGVETRADGTGVGRRRSGRVVWRRGGDRRQRLARGVRVGGGEGVMTPAITPEPTHPRKPKPQKRGEPHHGVHRMLTLAESRLEKVSP
jgi:hypothetical protein